MAQERLRLVDVLTELVSSVLKPPRAHVHTCTDSIDNGVSVVTRADMWGLVPAAWRPRLQTRLTPSAQLSPIPPAHTGPGCSFLGEVATSDSSSSPSASSSRL